MKLVLTYTKYDGAGGKLKTLPLEYESVRLAMKDFLAAANKNKKEHTFTFLGEFFFKHEVFEWDGRYVVKEYKGAKFFTLNQWFEDNKMAY